MIMKMLPLQGDKLLFLFLLFFISIAVSSAKTFNITKELQSHPSLSEFNKALTESGLAKSINSRQSITVCALTNSQMQALKSSLGTDASDIKKVAAYIRPLILLTFIDPTNPHTAKAINGSQPVSSMYQAAGTALEGQGVANLTKTKKGGLQIVTYGGSNATITKTVKLIGFDLSIVEVSNIVSPDGIVESEDRPVIPDSTPAPTPAKKPKSPPVEDSSTDTSDEDSTDEDSGKKPSSGHRNLPTLLGFGSTLAFLLSLLI